MSMINIGGIVKSAVTQLSNVQGNVAGAGAAAANQAVPRALQELGHSMKDLFEKASAANSSSPASGASSSSSSPGSSASGAAGGKKKKKKHGGLKGLLQKLMLMLQKLMPMLEKLIPGLSGVTGALTSTTQQS